MVISLLRYYLTDYIGVYRTRVASLKSTASRLKVYNDPYIPPSNLEDASKVPFNKRQVTVVNGSL